MFVPIGAWCKTAYQVNEFLKKHGVAPVSYPFDWMITPFSSLQKIFDQAFSPEEVLKLSHMQPSPFGSVTDDYTKLIHHHDFTPTRLKEFSAMSGINDKGLPIALYDSYLIDKARDRFAHTWQHLNHLRQVEDKLLFVRWQKGGHPDPLLKGESVGALVAVMSSYFEHDNLSILTVKTKVVDDLPEEVILEYEREEFGVSATIAERPGFDGDGTFHFKGDTVSWDKMLSCFAAEEGFAHLSTNT